MNKKRIKLLFADIVVLVSSLMIFGTPLYFLVVNSFKEEKASRQLQIGWPETFAIQENYLEAFSDQNYLILTAFKNSVLITLFSVIGLVIVCSMAGYVLQRRAGERRTGILNYLFMAGLMIPPAIMPTIWVLQGMHMYKTLYSMVLIEIALQIPFVITLYRGYMGSIPREIEEAAMIDGCGRVGIFTRIVSPLLTPISSTAVILSAVTIFNDFMNPLYFLPGKENSTIQLTLYNYIGKYASKYNLLFANIVIITVPMLILFIFFNKKIIAGMASGAVKG